MIEYRQNTHVANSPESSHYRRLHNGEKKQIPRFVSPELMPASQRAEESIDTDDWMVISQ